MGSLHPTRQGGVTLFMVVLLKVCLPVGPSSPTPPALLKTDRMLPWCPHLTSQSCLKALKILSLPFSGSPLAQAAGPVQRLLTCSSLW